MDTPNEGNLSPTTDEDRKTENDGGEEIASEIRNVRKSKSINKMLHKALKDGRLEDFIELLQEVGASRTVESQLIVCLETACKLEDREKFIEILLERVKPNINNIVPEPIHWVARKGNPDGLKVLLSDRRVKVNVEDSDGRTALHLACRHFPLKEDNYNSENYDSCVKRYELCIKLLLSHKDIDINRPNREWFTPIHEAAHRCEEAVVAFLHNAKQEIELDRYRARGETARESIEYEYPGLKDSLPLQRRIVSHTGDGHSKLCDALIRRDKDYFRSLLKSQDSDGQNLLHPDHRYGPPLNATLLELACREIGCKEFVKSLLDAGANPNLVNTVTHKSPIHVAVEMGNVDALRVLLYRKGINVNASDKLGRTALHYAVNNDMECDGSSYTECLNILLHKVHINVNAKDKGEFTPLMFALLKQNKKAVELILKQEFHYVDLDSAPQTHSTPRKLIHELFPEFIDILPSFNEEFRQGMDTNSLLYQCLHKGEEEEFMTTLSPLGIDEVSKMNLNNTHETLVQCACRYGYTDAVRTLLKKGFNPNSITDENKSPPLVIASMSSNYALMKLLLENSSTHAIDINAGDFQGDTALHYAVKNSDLESTILLLKHGANPKCKNSTERIAMNLKYMKTILDKCITANDKFRSEEDYEVMFDYRLLTSYLDDPHVARPIESTDTSISVESDPLNEDNSNVCRSQIELNLLNFMSQREELVELLSHPLVHSFLDLKWHKLRYASYLHSFIYFIFLLIFNIFVVPKSKGIDVSNDNSNLGNESAYSSSVNAIAQDAVHCSDGSVFTRLSLVLFWVILLTIEIFRCIISCKRYAIQIENYMIMAVFLLTFVTLVVTRCQTNDILNIFTAFVILLAWIVLLILIGQGSIFASDMEILKIVLMKYAYVSIFFSIIYIAFSIAFHIYLWNETLSTSFVKTLIMTAGEFDVDHSFFKSVPVAGQILFALFVIIVPVIVLNLLVAISLSSTKDIQDNAFIIHLEKRIKIAWEIETFITRYLKFLREKCAYFKEITLFPSKDSKQIGTLRPNGSNLIKLCSHETSFELTRNILDKAVKIVRDKHRPEYCTEKRPELEDSVAEMIEILKSRTDIALRRKR